MKAHTLTSVSGQIRGRFLEKKLYLESKDSRKRMKLVEAVGMWSRFSVQMNRWAAEFGMCWLGQLGLRETIERE